jgi:hypothetical protein
MSMNRCEVLMADQDAWIWQEPSGGWTYDQQVANVRRLTNALADALHSALQPVAAQRPDGDCRDIVQIGRDYLCFRVRSVDSGDTALAYGAIITLQWKDGAAEAVACVFPFLHGTRVAPMGTQSLLQCHFERDGRWRLDGWTSDEFGEYEQYGRRYFQELAPWQSD